MKTNRIVLLAALALAGCGATKVVTRTVPAAPSRADCAARGDCPLSIARASSLTASFARDVIRGSEHPSSGVSGCRQDSPRRVSCGYFVRTQNGLDSYGKPQWCHQSAVLVVTQPSFQRALQLRNEGGGTCR